MSDLELSRLFIYPIKSAGGIEVSTARVLERGLEYDRRFMVVDTEGHLVTSRQATALLTVTTQIIGDRLVVRAPAMPDLNLPLVPSSSLERRASLEMYGPESPVRVWLDWMPGVNVGPVAAEWFSTVLSADVRLVWMPEHSQRRMNPNFGPNYLSYADGNPLHLVSEDSLRDLEARVGARVAVERFRPNLVVRGEPAYAEDSWAQLRFADLELTLHEACIRCMVVNLEPNGGAMTPEPLRTLARYRRHGKAVLFGQHLHALEPGLLRVGQRGIASPRQ